MGKKIITAVVFVLLSMSAMPQDLVSSLIDDLDRDCRQGIVQINLSGKMLRLAAENDPQADPEIKEIFNNIDKISMVTDLAVNEKVKKQLEKHIGAYEELMQVIDDHQTVRMYTKGSEKKIEELVMYVISDNKMVLMSIKGKIDLRQIARLSGSLKIQGVEHLDKITKNKKK